MRVAWAVFFLWLMLFGVPGTALPGTAFPVTALADMAPPGQPPGSNPGPGSEATQVRMLAENVLLDVQPVGEGSLGRAQVTADFTMRNLGDKRERMAARFPIGSIDKFEISDLQVQVDGKNVRTRRILGDDPEYGFVQVPWVEFDVGFPPDKDVNVRVTYTLEGMGWYPYTEFNYILSTGAGWKDSIGSADLVVKLPYEANMYNTLLSGDTGYGFTSPGAVFDGQKIRWHFEDLEPTTEDNLESSWWRHHFGRQALQEQANVDRNPEDGEAWGRLGKVYKEIAFLPKELRPDEGGQALVELSIQAYEKCLELLPNDAEWHAGFAELYYYLYFTGHWKNPDDYSDMLRALELLKRAVEIDPESPKAIELLDEIEWRGYVSKQNGAYDFLLLTATPTKESTSAPQATLTSTATLPPSETPTRTTTVTVTGAPRDALVISSEAPGATYPAAISEVEATQPAGAPATPTSDRYTGCTGRAKAR